MEHFSPSSAERISERIVEQLVVAQNVDISSGAGLGQGSSSSAGPADDDFTGFCFALSSMEKSAECRAGGECAAGWARQLIHAERSSNGSCRRARGLWRVKLHVGETDQTYYLARAFGCQGRLDGRDK